MEKSNHADMKGKLAGVDASAVIDKRWLL